MLTCFNEILCEFVVSTEEGSNFFQIRSRPDGTVVVSCQYYTCMP